ncbi:hypothetical protein, partial [Tetragenococcus halophilus]|uniref:hypothetical protein n=1 Tax=Tetragenococcus halophilus TaxID=51669 RepID=UPI00300FF5D6
MKAKIYGVSKTENDILPLEKIKIVTSIEEGKTVIDGGTILTDSVNAKSIAANAITTNKLAADSITGEKIKANTIDVNKLKTHQIVLPNTNYGGVKITDEGMIAESKGNKIILSSDVGLLVQNKKTNKDVLSLDATTGEVSLDVAKLSISSNSVATENYVQDKSDSAVSESKKHTDEQIESININERNLLKDTSEDWTEITFKDFTPSSIVYKPEQIGLSIRDSIVYSMEIDNSIDKNNTSGSRVAIDFFNSNDALLGTMLGTVIKAGEKDKSVGKKEIPNNTSYMKIHDAYKAETGKTKTLAVRRQKLQRGKYATDWTPAPEDARDYADSVSDKAQDKALKESKTYTDNKIDISEDGITLGYKEYTDNKVESLDINDKNLFLGSYNEWLTKTFKNYTDGNHHIKLEDVGLNQGDTITFSIDIDNSIDKENKDEARAVFNFYDKSGNRISSTSSYIPLPSVEYGQVERISRTEIIPEGTYDIQIFDFSKTEDEKEKTLAVRRQKLQRGNRATDWTPAYQDTIQESLDKAVEYTDSEIKTAKDGIKLEYKSYTDDEVNKAKAQSKKDIETTNREVKEAKSSAQEANKSIADMAKDTILSKIEKKTLQTDWDVIHSEYPRLKAQGEKYDIDTTDYIDSYSSLESYIEPILKDKNQDTTIVPSTFKKKFTNYYDEKLSLMNLVNDKVKELGDKAVEEAYDYVDSQIKLTKDGISLDYKNYTDGKIEDSEERNKKTVTELEKSITQAKTSADSANKSIADMAKNTILSPIEKTSLAKEWEAIQSEYPKLKAQAKKYEVSDKKLNAKYSSLKEYITPLLKEVDKDSTIKPTSFKQTFKEYYDEKLDVMNLINDRIKELGDIAVGEAYEYVDSQIDMTKEGISLGYKNYTDNKISSSEKKTNDTINGIQSSGGNLIQNGNFENGFTGWDPAASASLVN